MARLVVFNSVSLDGYFVDSRGDMSWAHKAPDDAEWSAFVRENASGGGALLFGRVTYEMMASYWPTPMAAAQNPGVAEGMNQMPKYVASRSLTETTWSNTTLLDGDLVESVARLKSESPVGIAVLGSGTIVAQLAAAGVIDEFQIIVCPIVLGSGRTLFDGAGLIDLKLTESRAFGNGSVLLRYEPA